MEPYEKKYKEALKRAKDMLSYKEVRQEDMEYLFPELKESGDERIRKRILLSLQKDFMATKNSGCSTKDLEECIAWLEKQSEKPQGKTALEAIQEKEADNRNCVDGYGIKEGGFSIPTKPAMFSKQEPATWSEEDDAYIFFAISAVEDYYDEKNPLQKGLVDWLKSLKDRIQH